MNKWWWIACVAACPLLVGAQAPRQDASVQELVDALQPSNAAPVTRGLGRNLRVEAQAPVAAERPQVDLVVNFDFGSARVQDESRPLLQRLASAMQSDELKPLRFEIQGHTDGVGSAAYNQRLSARRAASVADFLAAQGVDRRRLAAVGRGSSELLDPADPASARNRRVRVMLQP